MTNFKLGNTGVVIFQLFSYLKILPMHPDEKNSIFHAKNNPYANKNNDNLKKW